MFVNTVSTTFKRVVELFYCLNEGELKPPLISSKEWNEGKSQPYHRSEMRVSPKGIRFTPNPSKGVELGPVFNYLEGVKRETTPNPSKGVE